MAAAVLAARHASPAEVSPVLPAHEPWRAFWTWGVTAAFGLYAAGAWLARKRALSLRVAVITAVVVQALPLAGPLLLSKDVYLYWSEARIAIVHHANPYRAVPDDYPADPAHATGLGDLAPRDGALRTRLGGARHTSGARPRNPRPTARSSATGCSRSSACSPPTLVVARRTRNAAAVALLGWSPLIALHYAGGGHSDAWMIALLVLGVAAPTAAAGGLAWPLASAFKVVPAVLLPLEVAARRLREPRRWWLALIGARPSSSRSQPTPSSGRTG